MNKKICLYAGIFLLLLAAPSIGYAKLDVPEDPTNEETTSKVLPANKEQTQNESVQQKVENINQYKEQLKEEVKEMEVQAKMEGKPYVNEETVSNNNENSDIESIKDYFELKLQIKNQYPDMGMQFQKLKELRTQKFEEARLRYQTAEKTSMGAQNKKVAAALVLTKAEMRISKAVEYMYFSLEKVNEAIKVQEESGFGVSEEVTTQLETIETMLSDVESYHEQLVNVISELDQIEETDMQAIQSKYVEGKELVKLSVQSLTEIKTSLIKLIRSIG